MGLFTKKDPCAICGGKVKGLFPGKIDGQYICNDCYGLVDLPDGSLSHMSVENFKAYMAFREENQQLKAQFQITREVDFGWFDTKFVFDANNRLLCMSKDLDKTIFEGKQIKSFIIKEDSAPIFECSAAGFIRYPSTVPERLQMMLPQIQMFRMQLERQRATQDEKDDLHFDIPEPFKMFNVEIRFDHPYWDVITADKEGPNFSNNYPDGNDYLRDYNTAFAAIEQLAMTLKEVAFPDVPEQTAGSGVVMSASAPAANVDAVAEIKRYKELMEQGVITEEEFTAKKKQLLGI